MRVMLVLDVALPGDTVLFIDSVARVAGFRFSLANEVGTNGCGVTVSQLTLSTSSAAPVRPREKVFMNTQRRKGSFPLRYGNR